jgi:hypothetical protein
MNRALSASRMKPVIDRIFPFCDAVSAFRYFEAVNHFGNAVTILGEFGGRWIIGSDIRLAMPRPRLESYSWFIYRWQRVRVARSGETPHIHNNKGKVSKGRQSAAVAAEPDGIPPATIEMDGRRR